MYQPENLEPQKTFDLTTFDHESIDSLQEGEKYVTENRLFEIKKKGANFIVTHGKEQVTMPGKYSLVGYLTH